MISFTPLLPHRVVMDTLEVSIRCREESTGTHSTVLNLALGRLYRAQSILVQTSGPLRMDWTL